MSRHLKRYLMPQSWPLSKKGNIWVVKPRAGPHKLEKSIPLTIILRDILKLVKTSTEASKIIKTGKILVDKKPRKDPKYSAGLMDIIEIPENKKQYRMSVNNKGLFLEEADSKDSDKKLCKIINKKTLSGKVFQLNLHDGRNILTENNEYKPGDSILISLPDQSIQDHFKLASGCKAIIVDGKNMGLQGKVSDMPKRVSMTSKNIVSLDIKGKKVETLKEYLMVLGG